MTQDIPEETTAEYHFRKFMQELGLEPNESEHLERTPERVAKAYRDELFRGLNEDPREHLERTFSSPKSGESNQMTEEVTDAGFVVQDGIQVKSMCAHHFLPFQGQAHVGYIPDEEIVGLSKLARVVDGYARKPQVQENLTNEIADAIHEELDPIATVVVVEATHECMSVRGVQEPESTTRTSALRGRARTDSHIKEEFFKIVGPQR